MADPYAPFGFAPPPTLGGPPRRMRSLAEMGFTPPQFPTAEGGLMPQSPEEATDLASQPNLYNMLIEASGMGPAGRSRQAFTGGRPLEGMGHAALAMVPYGPRAAMGTLGAAYGGAVGSDLGLFGTPQAQAQGGATTLPGLTPDQLKEYNDAKRRIDRGGFKTGAERRQLEETVRELRKVSNDFVTARNTATIAQESGKKKSDQDEYDRSVERAEQALAAELARDRRFSETNTGRLFEATGGLAPFGFGALAGATSRAATGGGRNMLYNYALPGGLGAAAGVTAANLPLAYNTLFTEPDNPQRRGYEAYARELPPTHPRRQEFANFASGLPAENPVRSEASRQLYDPVKLAERSGLGLVEGVLGGLTGAELVRIPSRLSGWLGGGSRTPPPGPGASPPTPPPGLASIGNQPRNPPPLSPESPPPVPSQVGAPPRPMPPGAYQDASGRWRVGRRWIRDPSK